MDSGVDGDLVWQVYKDGEFTFEAFWTEKEAKDYIEENMNEEDESLGRIR